MRLQLAFTGIALLLSGVTLQEDTAQTIEQSVHAVQTAFNQGDVESLKRLMTKDHETTLTYARFSNAAEQLKVANDFKLIDYKIEGLEVKMLGNDCALVTYRADVNGTYKGKKVPSPVRVVAVWVKRDRWREASYQETPIEPK